MKFRIKAISAAVMILAAHHATAGDVSNQAAIDRALGLIQQNSSTFKLSAASTSNKSLGVAADALPAASGDQFKAKDVITDRDGTEHVRFNRFYNGLAVVGGDTVVHSYHGQLKHASLSQPAAISLTQAVSSKTAGDVKGNITAATAKAIAVKSFKGKAAETVAPKLVVYARNTKPTLAYEVGVSGSGVAIGRVINGVLSTSKTPKSSVIYIAADSGVVLGTDELIKPFQSPPTTPPTTTPTNVVAAQGTGNTLYLGKVTLTTGQATDSVTQEKSYYLIDPSRGKGEVRDAKNAAANTGADVATLAKNSSSIFNKTNIFGDSKTTNRDSAAADIAYGVAKTWDYYLNVEGRKGIFNDNKGVTVYAHGGTGLDNAFWYDGCKCMVYGDGSDFNPVVALDVAGHEMTHGVTSATSALGYEQDAGGLNEGSSDIIGTQVEFYGATTAHPGNYLIGEDLQKDKKGGTNALRWMFKPSLDKSANVTFTDGTKGPLVSHDCYPATGFSKGEKIYNYPGGSISTYDPHFTSGVANHFFYLLAEGSVVPTGFSSTLTPSSLVCNGNTALTAIGHDKAGKIWYKALTQYFTSGTTYPQARTATLNAATDLYGANSTEYKAVAAAWSAVSVN